MSSPTPPTFHKTTSKSLKSSDKKSSRDMRRSNSSYFNWKKQLSYIRLCVRLRKQEEKWRQRPEKKLRDRGLWRRRRRRKHWSIFNNSRMRC